MRLPRLLAALALSVPAAFALGQPTPVEDQVRMLAPQAPALAGSQENFASLANGLSDGTTVVLTASAPDGTRQIVAFTPAAPLAPLEIARTLVAAKEALLSAGIGTPDPAQLAAALVGGSVKTTAGPVTLPTLVAPRDPKNPMAVVQRPYTGVAGNYKRLLDGLAAGTMIRLEPPAGEAPVIIVPPGGPMSAEETRQTLALANRLLADQGIRDPSPEQLRAALVGGSVETRAGTKVLLRGVMEGRQARAAAPASTSPEAHTSDVPPGTAPTSQAPTAHTSDSPRTGHTSDTPLRPHTSDVPQRSPARK